MTNWLHAITDPLNAASQTLQKAIEVRDTIKFGEEVGKLHGQILAAMSGAVAAKTDQSALLDEVRDLKKRVADLEGWEAEKERYELVELAPSVLAFRVKPSMQAGEPVHYICATCYNAGKKNFLKQIIHGPNYNKFECHSCGDSLAIAGRPKVSARPTIADDRGGWRMT